MKMRLKMKNKSHRYTVNKPRPRYGHKYSKYKMSQYDDDCMYQATIKQHLKLNS